MASAVRCCRNGRSPAALVFDGTLYYEAEPTAYGDYPYPLEMRFGVRSVMKSVAAPLSLLRLAEVYGPEVLDLKIGDYVPGLDPKWKRVRFIDAANMATGFGGTGTFETQPNDFYDGYLDADYDGWYTAPTSAGKLAHINAHLKPYPWEPGTVLRYRDQDFHVLGIAIDAYLKSKRGPHADAWDMLRHEVFEPIGIRAGAHGAHARGRRTRRSRLVQRRLLPVARRPGEDRAAVPGRRQARRQADPPSRPDAGPARGTRRTRQAQRQFACSARKDAPPPLYYKMGFHYTAYTGSPVRQDCACCRRCPASATTR